MGAGFRVFIGLGCEIGKGNRAGYGIFQFQRSFMTNTKPEAGENEPFVGIYSCMCLVSIYE